MTEEKNMSYVGRCGEVRGGEWLVGGGRGAGEEELHLITGLF